MEKENMNWAALAIPEDCHYIFICANEKIFDERIKHGMVNLYDNRKEQSETSLPCFIGYSPTANLKDLDTLAGLLSSRRDEFQNEKVAEIKAEIHDGPLWWLRKENNRNDSLNRLIKEEVSHELSKRTIKAIEDKVEHYVLTILLSAITAIIIIAIETAK